tara:strand:- start:7313 stop:7528 length:216 start_codon:yes stop_codon:yes gene_type:complete
MPKETKKKSLNDPCPICNKELYLDSKYTQRIGILDDFDEIDGWMCPHCKSEFDNENHLTKFLGTNGTRGEA